MKKYTRLALAATALLSIIAMLVYRYKYHNLRSIIDAMNFFTFKSKKSPECLSRHSNYNITPEIALSYNHWTELFDGIHVYSSHVMKRNVTSLAYSNDVTVTDLEKITCKLWFENETKSIESKLFIHFLKRENASYLFYFECWCNYDIGIPNAVTFVKDGVSTTVPVFHKQLYTGPYAACVDLSSDHFFDVNRIIEFLIYHSHIGIKHFLLYYTSFSRDVQEILINIANECDIIIEFLPWITPPKFEQNRLKLQPYFIDCLFHISSLNHSDFVFLLDLNNFVFLEETSNIKKLMYDHSPFDYLGMEKKMFCLEYPNDTIAKELNINFKTLLKTKVSKHVGQEIDVIYDVKQMMSNIYQIHGGFKTWLLTKKMQNYKIVKSSSASIFSYTNCKTQNYSDISYLVNKKMWLLKQEFFGSCIYKHAMPF